MAHGYGPEIRSHENVRNHYFESIPELLAAVDAARANPSPAYFNSGKGRGNSGWLADNPGSHYGVGGSWEGHKKLSLEGWAEGAARIEKLRVGVDRIIDKIRERSEALVYDVSGQWLDVGRFLDGEPECFGGYIQADFGGSSSKVIRVDVNIAASAGINEREFFERGAAAAAFCDAIEASGRRCEIYAVSGGYSKAYGLAMQVRVKIKSANEPLDLGRLAVAVADSGSYRRAVFSLRQDYGMDPDFSSPRDYRHELLPPELRDRFGSEEDSIVFDAAELEKVSGYGSFEKFLADNLVRLGISIDGLFE